MGYYIYHVPSGKFYHPTKGFVSISEAFESDEPRHFDGNEYISMFVSNNNGQQHFGADDCNAELKQAMNAQQVTADGRPPAPELPKKAPPAPTEYRFIHYRALRDANIGELAKNPTKSQYIESRGGATVAFVEPTEDSPLVYTIAYCHPNDNYWKAKGRMKAVCWFKANPDNQKRRERGPQIAQDMTVAEWLEVMDAEMVQWGYQRVIRVKRRNKKAKIVKADNYDPAPKMLPAPQTAATDSAYTGGCGGVEPGASMDDGPNYATG